MLLLLLPHVWGGSCRWRGGSQPALLSLYQIEQLLMRTINEGRKVVAPASIHIVLALSCGSGHAMASGTGF